MTKTSNFQKGRKYEKKYNSKLKKILRLFTPYIVIILIGMISFLFIFPEILKLLPFESLSTIGSFAEKVSNFTIFFGKLVFTNKFFLISISVLFVIILLIILLPLHHVSDNTFYTQKKLWLPYYHKIGVVIVQSSILNSSNTSMYSAHASKIHQAFMNCLSMKLKQISIAIYKHKDNVSILFPVMSKGWSKRRIEEQLRRRIIFISSSIDTNYTGKTKVLSSEQTRNFLFTLSMLSLRTNIDLSSNSLKNFSLTDQMYSIMVKKNNTDDACLIIKIEEKEKKEKQFSIDLTILSKNKLTESFILNASGLKKKPKKVSKKKLPFEKIISSSLRNKNLWNINEVASLMHIPYNYSGGSISLSTQNYETSFSDTIKNQDVIVIGKPVEENEIGTDIELDIKDLLLNVEIYGMIGRGKTRLVSSVLSQLIDRRISTIVFDIKGEYARTFAEDPRVEIFTIGRPRPLCINIFETLDEDDVRNTLLIIEEMMMSSNQDFTPAMKNLFENTLFLTHKSQKRNLGVFVENLFKFSRQVQLHSNISYIQQTIDAVLNRLNFIFNPINFEILGTTKTTLDFSILDEGKSIILDLSQFQRRAARPSDIFLICNLILKMFYRHATIKEITNRLRYVVILEEAINIIPNFYHSESSASLITAENNFLLGRSFGIGHITISQLWDSVSNVVHGNSATKIVFRSSEKTELIGRAMNLSEESTAKIQRLPTQHCYIFFEGSESALQMKTLDLVDNPISYSEYRTKMLKKYGRSAFPLLYNNFIDMRNSLYQSSDQRNSVKSGKSLTKRNYIDSQNKLDNFWLEKQNSQTQNPIQDTAEKETLDLIASTNIIPENLICERLCPDKNHNRECLKYKMGANIIKTSILNQLSPEDTLSLLCDEDNLFSTILETAKKRNLEFDDFLVFCTVRGVILSLASDRILEVSEAYKLLKKFSPRPQTKLI